MADVQTLKRIAHQLEQVAAATPSGDSYWPTLAQAAATALEAPPVVIQAALPAQPFLALVRRRDSLHVLGRAAVFADLIAPATSYLTEQGDTAVDVLLCEIRRVLSVS